MNLSSRYKILDNKHVKFLLNLVLISVVLYLFLFSIKLMGTSFKMFGQEFAENIISTTSNPFIALFIGILATSLIQSSSTTTSLVIGLVASGTLPLSGAIPIIMGANIGTTVTNTIVSMAHITRKLEFKRALAGSIVHDIFNIMTVIILFPLELKFHLLEKLSSLLAGYFVDFGGAKIFDPLNAIIDPAINFTKNNIDSPQFMLIIALILIFASLIALVKIMRGLIMSKAKVLLDYYLFKNDRTSFGVGLLMTAVVQSSSISTSIVVPMVGSGLLTIRQIFPYMLGSNIGTTTTAIMAAMATANPIAVTVAFCHLLFNIFGIIIIYPFRGIPIRLAESIAEFAAQSKKNTFVFLASYCLLYLMPIIFIIF
ncbi:MAG: Na/Pi symporter [Candidatus Pacebacteria bacterium]|nr:Na/Pi symporter [Candidatus Paceibacterota bacterium]